MALKLLSKFAMKQGLGRQIFLFSTIVSVLVLSYVLPRLSGPSNCINSTIVEEITILPGHRKLEECNLYSRVMTPAPPEWLSATQILERLESVDHIRTLWPTPEEKIKVEVSADTETSVIFREGVLKIGRNALLQPGTFEKAIVQFWMGLRDPMTAHVAAEFLWAAALGNGPKSSDNANELWIQNLLSLSGYCEMAQNVLQHEEFCSMQRELREGLVSDDSDGGAVIWALNRYFTSVLNSLFTDATLEEKTKLITRILFLNGLEDKAGFAEMVQATSLKDLDQAFENQVAQVLAPLDIAPEKIHQAVRKFQMVREDRKYDYILIDNEFDWSYPDLKTATAAAAGPIVIESGGGKYMFPSDIPLYFSRDQFFEDLTIRTVTIVACETPRPSRILQFDGDEVKKVLFLRVCDEPERVDKILAMGPEAYVNADKSSEFIEFNLAGLRVARKQRGELQGAVNMKNLGTWLDWKEIQFEKVHATYRPIAAYEAISRLRLKKF